jgi:glycerate kinase
MNPSPRDRLSSNAPRRILICPDKFKGCMSAASAASAIGRGWARAMPGVELHFAPIADGGEGFCEALHLALGGSWIDVETEDALGRPVRARYLWIESTRTAVIEMSEASGLWRIRRQELDPMRANTFGTGILLRDAIRRGAGRIWMGLGGSATTDGGMGMAAALGVRFLDAEGNVLEPLPSNLVRVREVDTSACPVFPALVAACDVQNPLLGARGTASVYAPQKGASAQHVELLERGLAVYAEAVGRRVGVDLWDSPGAGAAGGIAFGLMSLCGAKMEAGFDLVARVVGLEERIRSADLVVTGEGRLDAQSLEGKGPVGLARLARACGKPVMGFAGSLQEHAGLWEVFDAIVPLAEGPVSLEESVRGGVEFLERAAFRAARLLRMQDYL